MKGSNLEICFFVLFLIVFLEHQASQESPNTAKKPPKLAPGKHREPFKILVNFLMQVVLGNGPKVIKKRSNKLQQNCKKQQTEIIILKTILGPQMGTKIP